MYRTVFKKNRISRAISYFSFIYLTLSSTHIPSAVFAECCEVCVDEQEERRAKMARVLTGATIIGLGLGIGCAVSNCNHRYRHEYYDSDSYYRDSCSYLDSCSYSSDSSFSSFGSSSSSGSSEVSKVEFEIGSDVKIKQIGQEASQQTHALTGTFTTTPVSSESNNDHLTFFVQHPNGQTQTLGHVSLSCSQEAVPFGPFNQTGTYTFGMIIDKESVQPIQALKLGNLELNKNGNQVQIHEINTPHVPTGSHTFYLSQYELM